MTSPATAASSPAVTEADRANEAHRSEARQDWERRIYRRLTDTDHADASSELPAPAGVRAASAVGHIRLSWEAVPGAAGYVAVNPTTGAVGHRILVLDQSMIMASLDNALQNRAMQRHFAQDPVSWAARTYLSIEKMSIG